MPATFLFFGGSFLGETPSEKLPEKIPQSAFKRVAVSKRTRPWIRSDCSDDCSGRLTHCGSCPCQDLNFECIIEKPLVVAGLVSDFI